MTLTAKHRTLFDKLGIGGLSLLILLAGVTIYYNTIWRYRLVLRGESLILGAPTPFVCVGGILSFVILLIIRHVSTAQNRRIGWGICKGRARGGPLQWEDVILCIIPGTILGTIGTALFINSYFDKSPEQSHTSRITQRYTRLSSKGGQSYYMCLDDWKIPQSQVNLAFDRQTFSAHRVGEHVTIKTKRGFLGYEWITNFK